MSLFLASSLTNLMASVILLVFLAASLSFLPFLLLVTKNPPLLPYTLSISLYRTGCGATGVNSVKTPSVKASSISSSSSSPSPRYFKTSSLSNQRISLICVAVIQSGYNS